MTSQIPHCNDRSARSKLEQDTPLTIPKDVDNSSSPTAEQAAPSSSSANNEISPFAKTCTFCSKPRNVLIRCQIDDTSQWHFVCPGSCWQKVSGGHADGTAEHPHYRYGGTWKNKHEYVSGKIKGKAKKDSKEAANGTSGPHRRLGSKKWKPKFDKGTRVEIGKDDGGSDIEVSDPDDLEVGEEDERDHKGLADGGTGSGRVQVKRAEDVWEDPKGFEEYGKEEGEDGTQVKLSEN